jgi:Ulp1 family protease
VRGFQKKNIFDYEVVIFPVYVNYWTLLIIDFTRKKTIYYDPLKLNRYLENILVKVFKFIEEELKLNFHQKIEFSEYRDLTFEKGFDGATFKDHETGVFTCR